MATYLATYRIGDIVDIKANAAEQKGMVSIDVDRILQGYLAQVVLIRQSSCLCAFS